MVTLVGDDPKAGAGDMVLEVDRVEDARTVRQRLLIPAAQWQEFLAAVAAGDVPATVEEAYRAQREFWDWLAGEQADAPPEAPVTGVHEQPVAPTAAWLGARYQDWQNRA